MQYSKEQFDGFLKKWAAGDLDAKKELYNFMVDCFMLSDVNFDGGVDPVEFDQMIEAAAPKLHGHGPPSATAYKTPEERLKARKDMFAAMDINGDGQISLEEWMGFVNKHMTK